MNILQNVHASAKKKILFLPHAVLQMSKTDRMITTTEARSVVFNGEIIEDYPDDARGHSCLILGFGETERPIHVICSPKEDYLAVITAYLPDKKQWSEDYKTRVKS